PKRGDETRGKPKKRLDSFKHRNAFEGAHLHQFEIEAFARNDLRFKPARSADKKDLGFAFPPPELVRDGDARIDVPASSTSRDNHPHTNLGLRILPNPQFSLFTPPPSRALIYSTARPRQTD